MKIFIHTDGGARGNPGPAAVGVVIEVESGKEGKKIIVEFGKRIGETTNNIAEYTAVLEALREVNSQIITFETEEGEKIEITFFLDSMLVVYQLNGLYKIKDSKLRQLYVEIKILEQGIRGTIAYNYISREENKRADELVNRALDKHIPILRRFATRRVVKTARDVSGY